MIDFLPDTMKLPGMGKIHLAVQSPLECIYIEWKQIVLPILKN